MYLSNTLFNSVADKLKLKVSLLNEEKLHIKNLLSQANSLKKLKKHNRNDLNKKKFKNIQDLTVVYVINISFLKTNTIINISDIKGNIQLFYSAGSVGLKGKQKKNRRLVISKLITLLIKKTIPLHKKPIALHLSNINFYKKLIIHKLKQVFYIRVIKTFNKTPHNGCLLYTSDAADEA